MQHMQYTTPKKTNTPTKQMMMIPMTSPMLIPDDDEVVELDVDLMVIGLVSVTPVVLKFEAPFNAALAFNLDVNEALLPRPAFNCLPIALAAEELAVPV